MQFMPMLPVAAIVLAACASAPAAQPFDLTRLDAFTPGVTTKAEVVKVLGEPTSRMPGGSGPSTVYYDFDVTPSVENGNVSRITVMMIFDPEDKLVSKRNLAFARQQ